MDQTIKSFILENNASYHTLFENFAYKNEPRSVFEHECEHYVQPLTQKLIPMLVELLEKDPNENIENYLSYVTDRYRDVVRNEFNAYQSKKANFLKDTSRHIEETFMAKILDYNNKSEEEKSLFINSFLKENAKNFAMLSKNDVPLFLKTVSTLRTPKMQYAILHLYKEIISNVSTYLSGLSKEELDTTLKNYFFYPLEMEVSTYYKKWIGKDKIHIKLVKDLFTDRYNYAKTALKMMNKGKTPTIEKFNELIQVTEKTELELSENPPESRSMMS